jgi:hypothetical protein
MGMIGFVLACLGRWFRVILLFWLGLLCFADDCAAWVLEMLLLRDSCGSIYIVEVAVVLVNAFCEEAAN